MENSIISQGKTKMSGLPRSWRREHGPADSLRFGLPVCRIAREYISVVF
jgi:hypothetical protein